VKRTGVFVLLLLFPFFASAQEYPSRPVRVVVPYSAGGSSDGPMRVIAQEMSKQLGQQMVVENKPGQGAMLGSAEVVKAPPDGYTLLLASNPNAISASLYSKLTHDPVEDFAPISLLASEQAVLLVHPSVPAKTVQEFIAYVKANPGKVRIGNSGAGSHTHFTAAALRTRRITGDVASNGKQPRGELGPRFVLGSGAVDSQEYLLGQIFGHRGARPDVME
jgi:tripartite-type tricarboxylate transporter receptor subunit TctC